MYSSVVPSWAATSSQNASISRRSAWREVIGRPSPSEWVRDCDDEKPETAGRERLGQQRAHGGDLVVGGHLVAARRPP